MAIENSTIPGTSGSKDGFDYNLSVGRWDSSWLRTVQWLLNDCTGRPRESRVGVSLCASTLCAVRCVPGCLCLDACACAGHYVPLLHPWVYRRHHDAALGHWCWVGAPFKLLPLAGLVPCGSLIASVCMSGVMLSAAVAPTPPLQPERPRPQLQRQLLVQAQDPREEGKGCGLPLVQAFTSFPTLDAPCYGVTLLWASTFSGQVRASGSSLLPCA